MENTMNSERSQAYGRVVKTLEDMAAAKLFAPEERRIRDAADTLLFCESIDAPGAREALADLEALRTHLVESERWSADRASELADDVAACGPVTQLA
jgi:hypothetical protein